MNNSKNLRPLVSALLLAGTLFPATALDAQERAADARLTRPVPSGANGTKAAGAPPAATHVAVGKMAVAPDLQVTMSPLSKNTVPTQFIVKNSGFGETDKPTVLWVMTQLQPMKSEKVSCTGNSLACAFAAELQSMLAYNDLMQTCGTPMQPIQAEIPPLEPGQSHTVTGTPAPVSHKVARLSRPPNYSYMKSATLVCVFETVATADGTKAVTESNEQNNEARQRFEHEIEWH